MYSLLVFYADGPQPRERHQLRSGAEVLDRIPKLLAEHGGCERIGVYLGQTFLFAVDCKGNRIAP